MSTEVRVRIAPSPTGDPHVGTAYIALFNLAFARQQGGKFVLRIEDTDRARSTRESEEAIYGSLRWLGLHWDEGPDVGGPAGPYRQSERGDLYREHARKLLDCGAAYRCFCTPERLAELRQKQREAKAPIHYDRRCLGLSEAEVRERLDAGTPHVLRLLVPAGTTTVHDRLRGDIVFENAEIDDQVLLKSDGFPTYHLANVVDDRLMGITHVCRAEEWIVSTPKHVLLYGAFGWEPPAFIHMPLLRNADRSKISKRKNPTSLAWYRARGYLPEALVNFLGLMGYSLPDGREVFAFDEMVATFSWERVKTSGPVFDLAKLADLNGRHIRALSLDDLARRIAAFDPKAGAADPALVRRIAPLVQIRMDTLCDFDRMAGFFLEDARDYEPILLIPRKTSPRVTAQVLTVAAETFEGVGEWTHEALEAAARAMCEQHGWKPGTAFMPIRVATTGRLASPPLFESMEVLGRARSLALIREAIPLVGEAATTIVAVLEAAAPLLEAVPQPAWTAEAVEAAVRPISEGGERAEQTVQAALRLGTGRKPGKPLFDALASYGRERTLAAIQDSIQQFGQR